MLIAASNYGQLLVDNAKEIAEILGQDLTDKIMHSIPQTDEATSESFHEHVLGGLYRLLASTCVGLLVHATTSKHPQTKTLKSVLPAFRRVLAARKSECVVCIVKKHVSNIQKEAQVYKSKCEQLIETMTSGSIQSVDIIRSLF